MENSRWQMSLWTCGHRKERPSRFAPGWALDQNDQRMGQGQENKRSNQACSAHPGAKSGPKSGGVPKAANHRLLSGAHPGESQCGGAEFPSLIYGDLYLASEAFHLPGASISAIRAGFLICCPIIHASDRLISSFPSSLASNSPRLRLAAVA